MALQYYLQYKVAQSGNSSLNFISDKYGTPNGTGTVLGSWTGNGPGIEWNNGVPNKRTWSEELTGNSNATVNVWNAGTNKALIGFNYEGTDYYFDATKYDFSPTGFNTHNEYTMDSFLGPPTDRRPPVDPDFIPVYANIEIKSAPTADSHATNKGYVDSLLE